MELYSCNPYLGGGFKRFLFSPLPGEMINFDYYFLNGLKPPTSYKWPKKWLTGIKHPTYNPDFAFIFGNLFRENFSYSTPSWYPTQPFLIGCLVKQPLFKIKNWNHPIETTIKKTGLFGVPGWLDNSRLFGAGSIGLRKHVSLFEDLALEIRSLAKNIARCSGQDRFVGWMSCWVC